MDYILKVFLIKMNWNFSAGCSCWIKGRKLGMMMTFYRK